MFKVIENKDYVVYDEVLNENEFKNIQIYLKQEKYTIPHFNGWEKVWRITDSFPMASTAYYKTKMPFKNGLDTIAQYMIKIAENHINLVESFEEITFRTYLYPVGSKLSWHNDYGYKGAAIFYCHESWKNTWGGELMIAHAENESSIDHFGVGQYISSKPNRLIITKGGIWHSINRVDQNAGENVRSTIVGFYS